MRHTVSRLGPVAMLLVALSLATAFFLGQASDGSGTAVSAAATTLAVDADTEGNRAAALGPIDPCLSVTKGEDFPVDIVITDVDQLLAWEVYLVYDHSMLEIIDRDVQLLLVSSPGSRVIDISEGLPDIDGIYRIAAADIGGGDSESGPGILVRLNLQAGFEDGLATLDLKPIDKNGDDIPDLGPTLTDNTGEQIGDTDGDGFYDGEISAAQVAVDQPCPTPPPSAVSGSPPSADGSPVPLTEAAGDTAGGEQSSGSEDGAAGPVGSEDDGAAGPGTSEDGAAGSGTSVDGVLAAAAAGGSDETSSPGSDPTPESSDALSGRQGPSSSDGFAYWLAASILLGGLLLLGFGFAFIRLLWRRGV